MSEAVGGGEDDAGADEQTHPLSDIVLAPRPRDQCRPAGSCRNCQARPDPARQLQKSPALERQAVDLPDPVGEYLDHSRLLLHGVDGFPEAQRG